MYLDTALHVYQAGYVAKDDLGFLIPKYKLLCDLCGGEDQTQGFLVARQVLYLLSCIPSPPK